MYFSLRVLPCFPSLPLDARGTARDLVDVYSLEVRSGPSKSLRRITSDFERRPLRKTSLLRNEGVVLPCTLPVLNRDCATLAISKETRCLSALSESHWT